MRRLTRSFAQLAAMAACVLGSAVAQRHSLGSAPPTAPAVTPARPASQPAQPALIVRQPASATSGRAAATGTTNVIVHNPAPPPPPGPIAPISTGLGAIQFATASFGVPAPQSLTRQLSSDDERARIGALSSIGAPGQYLNHGHVPYPHSMELDMLQLSTSDELDAVLTVELDQHVVSAVLVPDSGNWKRVATLTFASAFSAGATTPSNFVRPLRSWLEPGRYRAVYHASVTSPNGDFTENEADLRVINGHAAVVISFVSGARQCDTAGLRPQHQSCELIQRWMEPDPNDPTHHFTLITGTGHMSARDADDPLTRSRNYRLTRLRSFSCQPYVYSDALQHFEPTANSAPCVAREPSPAHTEPPHSEAPRVEHP
jgi:hypothetical protein